MFHHHHSKRAILQHSASSGIPDKEQRKKYQHLIHDVTTRTKKAEQILGTVVENGVRTPHREDLEKVKSVLIGDVRKEEHRV